MALNRYDVAQLKRDAAKKGAWQAKLAYAVYLLNRNDENEAAKKYLNEVRNCGIPHYIFEVEYLEQVFLEKNFDSIAESSFAKQRNQIKQENQFNYRSSFESAVKNSPEYRYKELRHTYEHHPQAKDQQFIEENINNLQQLLPHGEMTDTLRAKIYFQLMRSNLELTQITGQRNHIDEAKRYGELLTKDSSLSSMNKAKQAGKILDKMKDIKPIYDVKQEIKSAFDSGKEGSRRVFKYIGIGVGNVLDLTFFPKFFGKWALENGDLKVPKNKTWSETYFKNAGFAALLKFGGKWFGKHLIGNLITGPIVAVGALITAPFEYLYRKYASFDQLKDLANTIANMQKSESKKSHRNNTTHQAVKLIFNQKDRSPEKILHYTSEEQSSKIDVQFKPPVLQKKCIVKGPYAYGRVWGGQPQTEINTQNLKQDNLTPVYR